MSTDRWVYQSVTKDRKGKFTAKFFCFSSNNPHRREAIVGEKFLSLFDLIILQSDAKPPAQSAKLSDRQREEYQVAEKELRSIMPFDLYIAEAKRATEHLETPPIDDFTRQKNACLQAIKVYQPGS